MTQQFVNDDSADRASRLVDERLPVARAFSRVFMLPVGAMALFAGLLIFQIYQLISDSRSVEHGDQVMLTGYESLNGLLSMETGFRGYLLTRQSEFLQPFKDGQPVLQSSLGKLARLAADDPPQAARVAAVRREVTGWLSWAADTLAASVHSRDYLSSVKEGVGKARVDRVRTLFRELFDEEIRLRADRTAKVRRATTATVALGLGVLIAGSLLFVYFARREIAALTSTYGDALSTVKRQQRNLQQARDEAEAASRAKDQFLATVSHELRNPLNPIMMWSVLLRDPRLAPEKQRHASEVIEQNVKSLAQLIDDLLDVARIESGKMRLDVGPVELQHVIEQAIQTVQPGAEAKQIRLGVVLDPRAGPIAGDPARLQQVVWNLLSNAIKFTPRGGSVRVTLARINSQVELTVADSGQGIAPDLLPHVFDPFWQGESGSTRRRGGLGLGLAIVRHLVELHAGTVAAESDGIGKGAVFKLTFPLFITARGSAADRGRLAADSATVPLTADRLDGMRILVVDDDRGSADAVATLLSRAGAEVRVAVSAQEAFDTLKSWQAHVLLSDVEMPGEDGYALIRRVRAQAPDVGSEIPAVALTAYARVEDRIRALEAGFQMHVTKPVDPAELVAVVASLAARI